MRRIVHGVLFGARSSASFASATGDLLFDLVSLDEMFLAFGYQPSFGPLSWSVLTYERPVVTRA